MRRIKDFFYDKNDIIIVLIILALAAFIIYTRIDAIMGYPEKLAKEAAATQTEETTQEAAKESQASDDSDASDAADGSKKVNGETTIEITDSDTAVSVAKKLEDAGLISSATEFEGYVTNMDQAESIKSGTFQIPSGSSDEEILNIITQ